MHSYPLQGKLKGTELVEIIRKASDESGFSFCNLDEKYNTEWNKPKSLYRCEKDGMIVDFPVDKRLQYSRLQCKENNSPFSSNGQLYDNDYAKLIGRIIGLSGKSLNTN